MLKFRCSWAIYTMMKKFNSEILTIDKLKSKTDNIIVNAELDYIVSVNRLDSDTIITSNDFSLSFEYDQIIEIVSCENILDIMELLVYNQNGDISSLERIISDPLYKYLISYSNRDDILSRVLEHKVSLDDPDVDDFYETVLKYLEYEELDSDILNSIDMSPDNRFLRFSCDSDYKVSTKNKYRNGLYNELCTYYNNLPERFKCLNTGLKFVKVKEINFALLRGNGHKYHNVSLNLFEDNSPVVIEDGTFILLDFNRFCMCNFSYGISGIIADESLNNFKYGCTFNTVDEFVRNIIDDEFMESGGLDILLYPKENGVDGESVIEFLYDGLADRVKANLFNLKDFVSLKGLQLSTLRYVMRRLIFKDYPDRLEFLDKHLEFLIADHGNLNGFTDNYIEKVWGEDYLNFSRRSSYMTFGMYVDRLLFIYTDLYFNKPVSNAKIILAEVANNKSKLF